MEEFTGNMTAAVIMTYSLATGPAHATYPRLHCYNISTNDEINCLTVIAGGNFFLGGGAAWLD